MNKDLVVAIYQEEITWLKQRNFSNERVFAYKKFERFDYDYVELLPNVGRESNTYIHHILKHLYVVILAKPNKNQVIIPGFFKEN